MPLQIVNRLPFNLFPASPAPGRAAGSAAAFAAATGLRPNAGRATATGVAYDISTNAPVTHGKQLTSSNTGIPAGTTLTTSNIGTAEITAGATNTIFNPTSFCIITADNQTFTRCRFLKGTIVVIGNGNTFNNCEFPESMSLSSSNNDTFYRCRTHTAAADLCDITGDQGPAPLDQCRNVQFTECLFDNSLAQAGDHADGMQIRGSDGLSLVRCRIDMGVQIEGHWKNAALFPQPANGGNANMSMVDSYLNGGGFMFYLTDISGTAVFTGNRFGPDLDFGYVLNETNFVPTAWSSNVVDATNATVPFTTN